MLSVSYRNHDESRFINNPLYLFYFLALILYWNVFIHIHQK